MILKYLSNSMTSLILFDADFRSSSCSQHVNLREFYRSKKDKEHTVMKIKRFFSKDILRHIFFQAVINFTCCINKSQT